MTDSPTGALSEREEEAGYMLLSELAAIDTYNCSLRDNPDAYEALERYHAALASTPPPISASKEAASLQKGRSILAAAKKTALERGARQAYDNTYHKVRADIGYDDWLMVWRKAIDWWTEPDPASASKEAAPAGDMVAEVAAALEVVRSRHIVEFVQAMDIGGMRADTPTPFQAGYQLACEEILTRLGGAPLTSPAPAQAPEPSSAVKAAQDSMCRQHGEALQRIGTLLGLPAGSNLHRAIEQRLSEPRAPVLPAWRHNLESACNYIDKLGGDSAAYRQALAASTTQPPATKGVES